MIRYFATLLVFALAANASEPEAASIEVPASTLVFSNSDAQNYPATFIDRRSTKVPAVSFAMCGVEAHGANADLDAGLVDHNVIDPAQAAGGYIDEPKDQGKNVRDFHSSIVLGVSVGYHF